ncbi:hypothetical protein ACIG5D_33585 [Microbispora rosea]|uniref:hypothetical protein n=1 Tax=Microbispora rosea TaxID=58117 RepID=UPI0037CAC266
MEGVLGGSVRQADTGLGVGAGVGVDLNADVTVGAGLDLNTDVTVGAGVGDRPAHTKARPEKHAQRSTPEKREPVPGHM